MPVHIGNDEISDLTRETWPTIKQREEAAGNDPMPTFGQLCATFGAAMQERATSPDRIAYALHHAGSIYAEWYGVANPSPAPEPEQPPAPEPDPERHPFPLGPGYLQAADDGWRVNGRPVNPLGLMAGDLILCFSEGKDITPVLRAARAAGYHYIGPTWNPLVWVRGTGGPFWGNRAFSPVSHGFDEWKRITKAFCQLVIDHEMKVFMANGGLVLATNEQETRCYEGLRDIQSELGADHFFCTGYLNEARDTSDRDDLEPPEQERLMNILRSAHPHNSYALTAWTGDTSPADVERFTRPWMKFAAYHGYRGQHYWDKLRHLQNKHYEEYRDIRPCFLNDEDFGPQGRNQHLSVQQFSSELDKHVMILAACIAAQGRCAYSFTCSPGIKFDEPFEDIPGFKEAPGFLQRHVPADLGTYRHLIHSGDGQDARRVFRAQNNLRIDGRVHDDGRLFFTAYGPPQDVTTAIVLDKAAEFDLVNTDEQAWHFSEGAEHRLPSLPVNKGYILKGRMR